MAFKRKSYTKRRRYGRRSFKKRGGYKPNGQYRLRKFRSSFKRSIVPRPLFPERKLMNFTYNTVLTMNPPIGNNILWHYFRMSLYDSDKSGLGHQPMGFDQVCPVIYKKYTVIGAKVVCRFGRSDTTYGTVPYIYALGKGNATTTFPTTINDTIENGNCKVGWSNIDPAVPIPTMSIGYSTRKELSVKNIMDEPALAGSATADAVNHGIIAVGVGSMDHQTDLGPVIVNVTIRFSAIMHDCVYLPAS